MAASMNFTGKDRFLGCLKKLERNTEDYIVLCLHGFDCGREEIYFAVYSPDRKDLVREHIAQIEAVVNTYYPPSTPTPNDETTPEDFINLDTFLSGVSIHWISNKSPVYTKEDGKQYVATFEAIAGVGCQWKELMGAVQLQELSTPGLKDAERLAMYHKEYHREWCLTDQRYYILDKSYWDLFPKGSLPEFVEKTLSERFVASPLCYYELPFNPVSVPQDCLDYAAEVGKYLENHTSYRMETERKRDEKDGNDDVDGDPYAYATIPNPWAIVKRTCIQSIGKEEFYKRYGENPFPSLGEAFP